MSVVEHRLLVVSVGGQASAAGCQCRWSGIGCWLSVSVVRHRLLIVDVDVD
jgi:hypothetical protein